MKLIIKEKEKEKDKTIKEEMLILSPSEWLIIRKALRGYCEDKFCPEDDRKLIEQMFDDVFEPTFVSEKESED